MSGGGYLYPSIFPALDAHVRRLSGYLAAADLDTVAILELRRDPFTTPYLDPYTREPGICGIFYLDYGRYAFYGGRMVWSNGTLAVSARFSLWEGQDSPASIASSERPFRCLPRARPAAPIRRPMRWIVQSSPPAGSEFVVRAG